MTVSTLRPSSTVSNSGVAVTGSSAHAALSDDSDSTYVDSIGAADGLRVGMGDLTLPAAAVIKQVALRVRAAKVGGAVPSSHLFSAGCLGAGVVVSVSNSLPTIQYAFVLTEHPTLLVPFTDSDLDGAEVTIGQGYPDANALRVYEVYLDATYVAQPVITVTSPTGTVTTTNTPNIAWGWNTLDADGGAETYYQAKIFTAAQYGAGGFDPETSTAHRSSGTVTQTGPGQGSAVFPGDPLADGTYRAYVKIAQTVNGDLHWSAWDYEGFVIDVDVPAAPDITVTPDAEFGRHLIELEGNAGAATTTAMEIERSLDGGDTWEPVRVTAADAAAFVTAGLVAPSSGAVMGTAATLYDYEAPNGTTVAYRARAVHNYSGLWAAGAWATASGVWSSTDWWLKCPLRPALNAVVVPDSIPSHQRPARQGVFQPLGRADTIVVGDTRGAARGSLRLDVATVTEMNEIDALLDAGETLLLQGPPEHYWPDRYIWVGDQDRARWIDKAFVKPVLDTLQWFELAVAVGDVDEWPA